MTKLAPKTIRDAVIAEMDRHGISAADLYSSMGERGPSRTALYAWLRGESDMLSSNASEVLLLLGLRITRQYPGRRNVRG